MWIDDAWVYQQLRQWDLDARRSELDLSDLYKTGDDRPAACPRETPGQPQTSHMASVRQYLPHADGDALSYAHNLLVGVLDRVFPPQLHPSGANWPLPLSVLEWPYFEWLLHTETDFAGYRDHLAHSLRVAVLGRWLIADCNWANTDRDRGRDRQGRLAQAAIKPKRVNQLLAALNLRDDAVTNRVVVAAWWLAALFHDIGYGVQLFGQIEKKIEGALPWTRETLPPAWCADADLRPSSEACFSTT